MKFILAIKDSMTQMFDDQGHVIPVTKVKAGPVYVTQVKTEKKDGVNGVQMGFGSKKKPNKAMRGHVKPSLKKVDEQKSFAYLREFQVEDPSAFHVGQKLTAKVFEKGDDVRVEGVSKGKGFQGVVKRHGFHGSPATHGHKDQHRMPGSIGSAYPQKVFKGKRMPGRMGGKQSTTLGLTVVDVDAEKGFIYIKGAVPGASNGLLKIMGPGGIVAEEVKQENEQPEEKSEIVESKK